MGSAIGAKTTLLRVRTRLVLSVVAGALFVAPAAHAAEIVEQPRNVRKGEVVRIEWLGETSSDASPPEVVVERRHGLRWVTHARLGAAGVLLDSLGEGRWRARWQPSYSNPSGFHRIRVGGSDDALTSDPFRVRPCRCVVPNPVRAKWRNGRFRLSVTAEYVPPSARGLVPLPRVVTTGRPVVRVLRDGRRVGSVLLRYRRGRFRGSWPGPRGPRASIVFQLVSLADAFGNR
jgi:hypothetical protein